MPQNSYEPGGLVNSLVSGTPETGNLVNQKRKISPRGSFRPDVPADIRPKTSVRPSKSWKKQAFWDGHAARTSTKKSRSEKLRADFRKIRAPIKIKSAPPPPPKPKIPPPPKTRNFMDMGFSCRKNAFFQASIKLAQPFSAPELQTRGFF